MADLDYETAHVTQKSHKSLLRDKIKHSVDGRGLAKKGGAGGKGTWGVPGDEADDRTSVDPRDPNYDPLDEDGDYAIEQVAYGESASAPPAPKKLAHFVSTHDNLNQFKAKVRTAVDEYLLSFDKNEFVTIINEENALVFHQDIPAIIVRKAFDKPEQQRKKLAGLLHYLYQKEVVTDEQMEQGFRKLFHHLDELVIDTPNAADLLHEFVHFAAAAEFLTAEAVKDMEDTAKKLSDGDNLASAKAQIKTLVNEYFDSGDVADAVKSLQELDLKAFHYEVIKQLISVALDRGDQEKDLAAQFLASTSGESIAVDEVTTAFEILLARVEDLYLDVPDILKQLSLFLARAVTDEAIPPAFLLRIPLADGDMGDQVVQQAKYLLEQDRAALRMSRVWIAHPGDAEDELPNPTPAEAAAILANGNK